MGVLAGLYIGGFIGGQIATYKMLRAMAKDPKPFLALAEKLKQIEADTTMPATSNDSETVEIEIENVDGMVYAYNKATGEFLAQAQNIYQAVSLASMRFPGKKFWHSSLKQDNQST